VKIDEGDAITADKFRGIDAAIDFTTPSAVVGNIEQLAALGVNIVVGTTGWQKQAEHVRQVVDQTGIGLVWSPNFSIGVNAFFRLVSAAAKLLANEKEYEAWAWEIHHSAKKDAPSGTLVKLVEEMRAAGYNRNIDIASNRAGAIPGTHEIGFDAGPDTITLRHTARNREGFALGAIKAAQWVVGKKGFHEFGEILF
jgi:4-hydroxy-tetrahydrodipicolinate reductase